MSGWWALSAELDAWRDAGLCAELWLRDDDAGAAAAPLHQLVDLCGEYGIPANFAAIPTASTPATADLIATLDSAFVFVHGYAHADHSGADERKSEYSCTRPFGEMEAEWREGIRMIEDLYGDNALRVFVPPWNRMPSDLQLRLADAGFIGYSARAHDLAVINVHVDLFDSRTHAFRGDEISLSGIVQHLRAKRTGNADPGEPTGVMTHHLVFDDAAWSFLRQLFAATGLEDGTRWLAGRRIFEIRP